MAEGDEDRRATPGRRREDEDAHAFAQTAFQAVAALRDAVTALGLQFANLATKEEVQAAEARQDARRRRLAWVGGIALGLLMVGTMGQYATLGQVRDIAVSNSDSNSILVECTTPGDLSSLDPDDRVHECYDRSQAATAAAVGQISLALLDAAICARLEATPETIQACYEKRVIARTGADPTP